MFRCQLCNKVSEVGEKQNSLIIQKRLTSYHYYVILSKSQRNKKKFITESKTVARAERNKIISEFDRKGWEIEQELKVCNYCIKEK